MLDAVDVMRRIRRRLVRPLGYVWPSLYAYLFESQRLPEWRGRPIEFGPAILLSAEPPIFLSGTVYDEFLGIAPSFARLLGNIKAGFIIYPTWSIESKEKTRYIAACVKRHVRKYTNHHFRYICNTEAEAELLNQSGLRALFLNHNFLVSEDIFRPLDTAEVEFDAIYNARFIAEKRHELAADIDKVAYVAFAERQESRQAEFHRRWAQTARRSPSHVLLNTLDQGLPVKMSHDEVNRALGRAATGLILSAVEGQNYATVEYMLAGLPVVSTPSRGGRDIFFDPHYCAIVEPNPRAVREAVVALKARNIPKNFIRAQTLKRIEADRRRLLDLTNDLLEELGGPRCFVPGTWPFLSRSGVPWDNFKHHIAAMEQAREQIQAEELALAPRSADGGPGHCP